MNQNKSEQKFVMWKWSTTTTTTTKLMCKLHLFHSYSLLLILGKSPPWIFSIGFYFIYRAGKRTKRFHGIKVAQTNQGCTRAFLLEKIQKETMVQKNLKILVACSYHCLKPVPHSVMQWLKNKCTHSNIATCYVIATAF